MQKIFKENIIRIKLISDNKSVKKQHSKSLFKPVPFISVSNERGKETLPKNYQTLTLDRKKHKKKQENKIKVFFVLLQEYVEFDSCLYLMTKSSSQARLLKNRLHPDLAGFRAHFSSPKHLGWIRGHKLSTMDRNRVFCPSVIYLYKELSTWYPFILYRVNFWI